MINLQVTIVLHFSAILSPQNFYYSTICNCCLQWIYGQILMLFFFFYSINLAQFYRQFWAIVSRGQLINFPVVNQLKFFFFFSRLFIKTFEVMRRLAFIGFCTCEKKIKTAESIGGWRMFNVVYICNSKFLDIVFFFFLHLKI